MIIDRKKTIRVRGQRRSSLRTYGAGCLGLVLLLASAPSVTSAAADDGADHRSLEERVMSDFFKVEPNQDVSSVIGTATGDNPFPACKNYPSPEDGPYRSCAGEVKTHDGLELDARVTFPSKASGPLPLVVLLHSWAGNRNGMQGNAEADDSNNLLSPVRFLKKGYATLVYTARGWQASCGSRDPVDDVIAAGGTDVPSEDACRKGHTHVAEREFEVADTQHLLGLLVDAGVADPHRLASAGGSYGGGQTWLLATAMPWTSPGGTTLQLAAAVPLAGWTDFYGVIAPNGRATDGIDQSASHQEPFGVAKPVHLNDTYRVGHTSGGRYNTTDPAERHSYFDGWLAVFNAGEPHATDRAKTLPAELRGKSAYYAHDYLEAVAARRARPVPILAVQGWTDAFFPAVEALQMYRKLKASHAGYPIKLLLGDLGHGSQNPEQQVDYTWDQVANFIDAHLGGEPDGVPVAASFPMLCAEGDHAAATADRWDALVKEKSLTFSSHEDRATDSLSSNIGEEVASDPTLVSKELPLNAPIDPFPSSGACAERDADASASGATWRWKVENEFTMLGLPTVSLPYEMKGQDATVVAKLWDVGPDGKKKVLVTRGVYRLSAPGQPLTFQLFGNHWRFGKDHTIELEVGQRDVPFLRPDNFPSKIAYHGVELRVPQAKTP